MSVNWNKVKEHFSKSDAIQSVLDIIRKTVGTVVTRAEAERKMLDVVNQLEKDGFENLWLIEKKVLPAIQENGSSLNAKLLEFFIREVNQHPEFGFINVPVDISDVDEIKIQQSSNTMSGIIGRVAIVKNPPATPYSFPFWLDRNPDIRLEIGDFITVVLPDGKKAVAVVDVVSSVSDIDDIVKHYFSWNFGAPEKEMPTEYPVIRHGTANIIYRGDGRNDPFISSFPILKAKEGELKEVFSEMIPKDRELLLGFVKDGEGFYVPVYGDFMYVFGYEGGHVNITGKSGIAGKTSYALFLIASALSYAREKNEKMAVIAFNVKETDLLEIGNIPFDSIDEGIRYINGIPELAESANMWEKAKELNVDPVRVFKNAICYVPSANRNAVMEGTNRKPYSYGLRDILDRGVIAFLSLFEPEDIDEKFEALVYGIMNQYNIYKTSASFSLSELEELEGFEEFGGFQGFEDTWSFQYLIDFLSSVNSGKKQTVEIGGIEHHVQTVRKMANRLGKIVHSHVIERNKPAGNPIPVNDLRNEDLWVIDIRQLSDNEQRMVFFMILSELQINLENRKNEQYGNQSKFPSRVSVFMDELNKFAPSSGKISSPVKQSIIEIASRGRSVGLTLIGAEQFASRIDDEILGNTSTYLIGKSEEFELANTFYKRMTEGFRKKIPHLSKGELVLIHEMHKVPIIINFPIPLHRIITRGGNSDA